MRFDPFDDPLWAIFGTMLLVGLVFFGTLMLSSAECTSKARAMGVPSSFGALQGCMVTYKGKIVPIEAVRAID